jgi:DNA repair protein RadC
VEGLVKPGTVLLPYRPSDIAGLLSPLALLNEEIMLLIYFDRNGLRVGEDVLSGGTSRSFSTRYRLIFERAFRHSASGILLIHNHPSGSPRPSQHDLASTRSFEALAAPMEVTLVDHLIVGARAVFSMRAAGLLT